MTEPLGARLSDEDGDMYRSDMHDLPTLECLSAGPGDSGGGPGVGAEACGRAGIREGRRGPGRRRRSGRSPGAHQVAAQLLTPESSVTISYEDISHMHCMLVCQCPEHLGLESESHPADAVPPGVREMRPGRS